MPFKVDLQLAEWCLMRTDIDSKVKWQWMLVYIRLHNGCVCIVYGFVVSGRQEGELLSNPADQHAGQNSGRAIPHGFPHCITAGVRQ